MKNIVIGEILRDKKVMGTGFLVSPDIVMTVKHNIILADDILEDEITEKEISFRINNHDEILGTTINLNVAIENEIDCVFIRLDEVPCEDEIQVLIECENDITGYECNTKGFPKLSKEGICLKGKIVSNQKEIIVSINKEDCLPTYEGLSGAPLMVAGNVVGIITRQENFERLEALSTKYIIEKLGKDNFKTIKRVIPSCFQNDVFSIEVLQQKAEQMINKVGPRYCKNLNIHTNIYKELSFILNKAGVNEKLCEVDDKIGECIKRLVQSISYTADEVYLFLEKSKNTILEVITQLKDDREHCNVNNYSGDLIKQLLLHMEVNKEKLKTIFDLEKKRFEDKYGVGKFEDKNWRGYMSAYMCAFPAQCLDDLLDIFKLFSEVMNMIDVDLINKVSNQAILISGKGGIGKTHLLCDIVNNYFEKGLPAVLFLGDLFQENTTADITIMNWYYRTKEMEQFFSWLNEIGEQNNVFIPVCIDAINEVSEKNYWNSNLPLLVAKVKKYKNIKIIFSCRSIYLEEYLESDKLNDLLQLEHYGFEEMEVEALSSFCEYYGVNINYDTASIPEFMNPLFLKMLCEIAQAKDDKTVIVDDIEKLMSDFFELKNKIISKNYAAFLSVRDNIVPVILKDITDYMAEKECYTISWSDLRKCVSNRLSEFGIQQNTSGFIKLLLSENLLRESDDNGSQISFAYQKFFEYLYSKKFENKSIEEIVTAVENRKITLGTLEMIQIDYFRQNKDEFLNVLDNKIHVQAVDSFISGLYWRKSDEINENTIVTIEGLLNGSRECDIRCAIIGLISISTKNNCKLNAFYIHNKLKKMTNTRRDYFLSYFLLKQYDSIKVLFDLCERAINLRETSFPKQIVLLWKIMLCWGTGSNDIKLRDKSSKGLANLFRLYPKDMLVIAEMFNDVQDDYIQERLWQAIYSTIIFLQDKEYAIPILNYIHEIYVLSGKWPRNVLIRDFLRNIFEYSYYKGWCTEKEVNSLRPPYHSKKHKVKKKNISKFKEKYSKLYWNCYYSDFVRYTIPSDVENYGVSKEDVGLLIFEDILQCGYNEIYANYDAYLDYTYGSLRNRDEQIERLGKKYQKIYLYREMGNLYDNYRYSPRYQYDEIEIVPPEQGNTFRTIDLTILNHENLFEGVNLKYPFYRYVKWDDLKWFKNNDIESYIPPMILTEYEGKEFYILQGYLSSKEVGKKAFREVWMQIRTYLLKKNEKDNLLKWFEGKDFEGRWMPEGFGQLYECCVGEYPWSPCMVNYLGQKEEQVFRKEEQPSCHLIPTVNDYSGDKDSLFCVDEHKSYMFPSKFMFDKMQLVWNGEYGYDHNGQTVILNGKNDTIFVEKQFLNDFISENGLEIVWTVLGEKQKLTGGLGQDFPGRSEFSFSYYLDGKNRLLKNHMIYNIVAPEKD